MTRLKYMSTQARLRTQFGTLEPAYMSMLILLYQWYCHCQLSTVSLAHPADQLIFVYYLNLCYE